MSLEQALLLLLFAYITAFLLLGLAKGRKYFRSYVSEGASSSYLFHSVEVTLTLAGLAMTALALFVGFGFQNLDRVSSIILFFSISFVVLALSSNFARFPKRAYQFIGDVFADVGVLAIGCGFLVFFHHELPLSHGLMFIYGLFIAFFLLLSSLDFYKYYKYWSLFNDEKEKSKETTVNNSNTHARVVEMDEKSKLTIKDMLLLLEGVLIAFLLQLLYDTIREEPFYQNLLPMQHWRTILTLIVAFFAFLLLHYLQEQK